LLTSEQADKNFAAADDDNNSDALPTTSKHELPFCDEIGPHEPLLIPQHF